MNKERKKEKAAGRVPFLFFFFFLFPDYSIDPCISIIITVSQAGRLARHDSEATFENNQSNQFCATYMHVCHKVWVDATTTYAQINYSFALFALHHTPPPPPPN
jgi:hypothetical protein